MKRIIRASLIFFLVIFLCNKYSNQPKLVLSFGNNINGNYTYYYNDTKITDIINNIKYNQKINNRFIQNILVKASTIYLDLNGIFNYQDYNTIKINIDDLKELIDLIKKYSKEKMVIILLKEKSELASYANQKIMLTFKNYDIIFLR